MKDLITEVLNATKKYTILDFAVLKTCLISIGVLFGVYFSKVLKPYRLVIWLIALVSYVYIMYKTFVKNFAR